MNRTPVARRVQIIDCLVEGNSIKSTEPCGYGIRARLCRGGSLPDGDGYGYASASIPILFQSCIAPKNRLICARLEDNLAAVCKGSGSPAATFRLTFVIIAPI
jgi:hypothetical protein